MVKYSPVLRLDRYGWWTNRKIDWICDQSEWWDVDNEQRIWIAISDEPTAGAVKITGTLSHDSVTCMLNCHADGKHFVRFLSFGRFLASLNTPTVWLWIEVPDDG